MKKTRRFAAMVAAMALAATMVAPTMMNAGAASDTSEITIPVTVVTDGNTANEVTDIKPDADNATHTYTAYQIFKGENKHTDAVGTEGDPDYVAAKDEFKITGLGKDAEALLDDTAFLAFRPSDADISVGEALAKLPSGASDDARAIAAAQAISGITSGSAKADELAEILSKVVSGGTEITTEAKNLAEGYYLVTDSYDPTDDETEKNPRPDAVSKFILRVNSAENTSITIIPKKSYPEVIKKVKENTDVADYTYNVGTTSVTDDDYNDVADYNIGDAVPFKLYGSMPETLDDYDAYYYKFTDTLGTQFDQPKEVTVKVGSKTLTFTLNAAKTAYELPTDDQLKPADAATVTTYTFKDAATQSKIYAALKDNTDYTGLSAAEKAAYINTNWSTLTNAENGALKDLGFTAVTDAITAKTTEIPAVNANPSTDGNCRVTWDSTNHKLLVSFENVKAYAGVASSTIVTVNYSAKLNNTAVIGLNGQENKVDLTYSNNPATEYAPRNDNEEDIPGDKDTTPEDKVVVFTYEVDINKIDADTNQNLEDFAFRTNTSDLSHRYKLMLSLLLASRICKRFEEGERPYTALELKLQTGIPIRMVHDLLNELVELNVISEVNTGDKGDDTYYQPAISLDKLSVRMVVDRIEAKGKWKLDLDMHQFEGEAWSKTFSLRAEFLKKSGEVLVKEL